MRWDNDSSELVFASGRRAYVNRNVIGIDHEGRISHGWDGGFQTDPEWSDDPLTDEDLAEMADEMIARWQRFREELADHHREER
jgi:hypothetical protein